VATDGGRAALAAYVRRLQLRAGLTQAALAERAGLTVDTVGALERGLRRRPQGLTACFAACGSVEVSALGSVIPSTTSSPMTIPS
jgi:transcriptional regulator with XRE-family HTH domain